MRVTFAAALLAAGVRVGAQATPPPVRTLLPTDRRPSAADVPASHRPPRGMCRIWLDNVPPTQQPAPTDCATAIRNRPTNGRVVFGDVDATVHRDTSARGNDKDTRRKPKRPEQ